MFNFESYSIDAILMICVAFFCFIFFAVRAAISLFYIHKGVKTSAAITKCEEVIIRKTKAVDKENVTANKYCYEYKDASETLHYGTIAGLYSADKFEEGDSIDVRYLSKTPEKSRYYPFKDFLQFEGPLFVIGVAAFLAVVIKATLWK